jgi:folate-binding protein YgfZ
MDLIDQDRILRTQAGVIEARDTGFIELAGPDARSFLQNLATNDVRSLKPGDGCEVFFTTHKARVVAHAIATCVNDQTFVLDVEPSRGDALFQHLNRYLISEQVELTAHGADWAMLRIIGPDADRWVERIAAQTVGDLTIWQRRELSQGLSIRRQGALHVRGYDAIGPTQQIVETLRDLQAAGLPIIDAEAIEPIRIESGWPRWGHEMDESRFVVELDRIAQAISYQKGCYLGQEPIVMARDRGQVNRRLMGLRFAGNEVPPPGTKLMAGEVEAVRVTSAAYSPAWKCAIGLAFVHRGQQVAGATIALPGPEGDFAAAVLSLPFVPE